MDDLETTRREIRRLRRSLTTAEQRAAAHAIAERLDRGAPLRSVRRVGVYLSFDGEVDLGPLIERLRARDVEVFVPVVLDDTLVFRRLDDQTQWHTNRFGIAEPAADADGSAQCAPTDLDVVIVPATAVDLRGNRLGMGGGFYDRAFAAATPPASTAPTAKPRRPLLIAAVHDLQVLETITPQDHDVAVDAIVTPTRWIDVQHPDRLVTD